MRKVWEWLKKSHGLVVKAYLTYNPRQWGLGPVGDYYSNYASLAVHIGPIEVGIYWDKEVD